MFKQSNALYVLITTMFLMGAGWIGFQIYKEGKAYSADRTQYAEVLSMENRLFSLMNWLSPDDEWQPKKQVASNLETSWNHHYDMIVADSLILFGLLAVYVMLVLLIWRSPDTAMMYRAGMILTVAVVSLVIGLTVPMMEIIAFNRDLTVKIDHDIASWIVGSERVFPGDTVHFYQNKSIVQLIQILFVSKNFVVGIAILLFSILLPVTKLVATYFIVFARNPRKVNGLKKVLGVIGKWSMADVFVASCFLAYLSFYNMSTGVQTDALTLPGLYFFLIYVILGVLSSRVADIVFKQKVSKLTGS